MTQSSEHDTTLDRAKPIQVSPHFHDRTVDDAYSRAHVNADTDSGNDAIHHTLGRPGGAAVFDHDHGIFTKKDIPLLNYSTAAPVLGSGGYSQVTWQKVSTEFMYLRFIIKWGTTGRNPQTNQWYHNWVYSGFAYGNKIMPVQDFTAFPATYLGLSSGVFIGRLIFDPVAKEWAYWWHTNLDSASGALQGGSAIGVGAGDLIIAEGTYEFKDVS
jgi:hypothetical protein